MSGPDETGMLTQSKLCYSKVFWSSETCFAIIERKKKMAKILIVEDDPTTVQLIEFLLKKNNFEVLIAHNGVEALEIAKKEKSDLILMDVMMPKMDGIEAIEKLKKDENTRDIPIVILSALGQEMDVMRGLQAGASSYIVKPFSPKELLEEIKTKLEGK
jgi:two-component system alkaline phosphatase synthesis response regulator PhoP